MGRNERIGTSRDPDDAFRTSHLHGDLRRRSVRGGSITILSQSVKFLLSMGSTVIMARLLDPSDFGVIAKIAIFIGFAELAKDLGLSMASVQHQHVTHRLASNLFWISVALSAMLGLAFAVIAPFVAMLYHDHRLMPVMLAYGGMFVLGGMASQHQALLLRQMRFASLEGCDMLARIAGYVAGIGFAWAGFNYWALVLAQAVWAATFSLSLWPATRWVPGLPSRQVGVRSMVAFGSQLTSVRVLSQLVNNVDRFVIGRFSGDQATGLYDRAYRLVLLPLQQINTPMSNVAIPALSRLQDDPERFRRAYLRSVSLLVTVTTPLFAFMLVWADQIILLLLGPKWVEAAGIFRIFALLGLSRPLTSVYDWLLVATGRTETQLRWRLLTIWVAPTFVSIGYVLAGVKGVAFGLTMGEWLFIVPSIWYAQRGTGVGTWPIVRTALRPIVAAAISGLVMLPLIGRLNVVLAAALMPVLYFTLSCLIARSLEPIQEIWRLRDAFVRVRPA